MTPMKMFLLAAMVIALTPMAAHAQVIEIDSAGVAQTYDGPTVFTASDAVAITRDVKVVLNEDPVALIEQAARVHQLDPTLLKAVAWQESRGRMSAVSNKGARGVMQLMPGTALALGVDSRSMAGNIRGGAMYLRQQIDRFGSVPLALAAYNAGPGAVIRYRGIPPYRETRDYVARIMGHWRPSLVTSPIQSIIVEVIK